MPIELRLEIEEISVLQRDVNGQGGLQSFLRRLQGKLDPNTGVITLEDDEVGKIIRMITYGPGGFEGRLRDAFRRPLSEAIG